MRFTFWSTIALVTIGLFAGYYMAETVVLRDENEHLRENQRLIYDCVETKLDDLYRRVCPPSYRHGNGRHHGGNGRH